MTPTPELEGALDLSGVADPGRLAELRALAGYEDQPDGHDVARRSGSAASAALADIALVIGDYTAVHGSLETSEACSVLLARVMRIIARGLGHR